MNLNTRVYKVMKKTVLLALVAFLAHISLFLNAQNSVADFSFTLDGGEKGSLFEGIGMVNGGGATSVLLRDYPKKQRSEILDYIFKPKFGASVSAMFVEIPGDGNSTQGSMPSHEHKRGDVNYHRGYTWWVMQEAKRRNPLLTLDGTAWSAPGWVGQGVFFSQDAADYYVSFLKGLRDVYGLEFTALGCRNEKGDDYNFVKTLRRTLNQNGFNKVRIHGFDNWYEGKLNFVDEMMKDEELRNSLDIISGHVFNEVDPVSKEHQSMAREMGKPIWNTEDHVYKPGFDCLIGLVECFNHNYIRSGVTKVINWYDIAALYPLEPYSLDPPSVLAYEPWSGHYTVRQALWGYAHYGQFTAIGWQYLPSACRMIDGGSVVAMKSAKGDYSIIIETNKASKEQTLTFNITGGLSRKSLCLWQSDEKAQFQKQANVSVKDGAFSLTVRPHTVYTLSTTRGQRKGETLPPASQPFPFPYEEDFEQYTNPKERGYLPRYTADICGAFEIVDTPDGTGKCMRQVVDKPTISWAPDWNHYTILGSKDWQDYTVSTDVLLNKGDVAGLMGRISEVGFGYGIVPKCYILELSEDGTLRLVRWNGKEDKTEVVGDAEQQALILKQNDKTRGGDYVLQECRIEGFNARLWHTLTLSFQGSLITASIDHRPLLKAEDTFFPTGMVGFMAQKTETSVATPYFDNIRVK